VLLVVLLVLMVLMLLKVPESHCSLSYGLQPTAYTLHPTTAEKLQKQPQRIHDISHIAYRIIASH
jgi:hypothetical protein